jgi:hypothetical protein
MVVRFYGNAALKFPAASQGLVHICYQLLKASVGKNIIFHNIIFILFRALFLVVRHFCFKPSSYFSNCPTNDFMRVAVKVAVNRLKTRKATEIGSLNLLILNMSRVGLEPTTLWLKARCSTD